MTSHTYDFTRNDLLRLLGLPLLPAALFAALMHGGVALRLLPAPRPTLDVDRTILVHQIAAARAPQDAEILLLGDSSCLMDVSARQLSEALGRPALNLGTLSYLDVNACAALLREFANANPGKARAVVLLMHPEALRRPSPESRHVALFDSLLAGKDFFPPASPRDWIARALGLEIFRGRLLCRWLPTPLSGAFGRRHGFSADLDAFLGAQRGSLLDPDPRPFQGNAEYRLAKQLEAGSQTFRAAVPAGAKLFVGITPAPAGFARADHAALHRDMLATWSRWLMADTALTNLPATLPDEFFVKTTHLSEAGVRAYTAALAAVLKEQLR